MGLFTQLVTLPLAPVRGVVWTVDRVLEAAEKEYYDPAPCKPISQNSSGSCLRGRSMRRRSTGARTNCWTGWKRSGRIGGEGSPDPARRGNTRPPS